MDPNSCKTIHDLLQNHPHFYGEEHGEFINLKNSTHIIRVVRFVGPGRCVLVFGYPTRWARADYTLSFLAQDGTLVLIDRKAIKADWETQNPGKMFPWERVFYKHVVAQGAREFKGVNWSGRLMDAPTPILDVWFQNRPATE